MLLYPVLPSFGSTVEYSPLIGVQEPKFGGKGGNQDHRNHVYYEAMAESERAGIPMADVLKQWRGELSNKRDKASKARLRLIQEAEKALGVRNKNKRDKQPPPTPTTGLDLSA